MVRRGLRGGRNVGVLAGRAEEGAFGEAGRNVSGEYWNVEVVAIVEVDDGVTESGGSVGVTIALGAVELGAELGRPSGGGSWRERIVLGRDFAGDASGWRVRWRWGVDVGRRGGNGLTFMGCADGRGRLACLVAASVGASRDTLTQLLGGLGFSCGFRRECFAVLGLSYQCARRLPPKTPVKLPAAVR